ncbi:hypothetical protein ACR9E3_11645 [Actinomycetospora sp. C-140]
MGTHRSSSASSSRVIGVHSLPIAVISLIREQAQQRGLVRDPLPEVTHAVRTDVVASAGRFFGRGRARHTFTEMLLTPDVLVVVDRDPERDGVDPDLQLAFHRLHQLEVTTTTEGLGLLSTPVGSTERGSRVVPAEGGPEMTRFHQALVEATENSRRVDVPASRMPDDAESVVEYS